MEKGDWANAESFAREVVQELQQRGYQALWAGGCVRDRLLGRVPHDYDVATNATPPEIRRIFGPRRTLMVGATFGVATVLNPAGDGSIEVATFRRDEGYSDGRHPDRVVFSSAEEDARRRDFTINGLFCDPLRDEILDFVGGREDLAARQIRSIGDPHLRFNEDKLRMLRAVRFTALLEFDLDQATLAAIQARAAELRLVSGERVGAEMRKILQAPQRRVGIEWLRTTNLWPEVLPELLPLDDSAEVAEVWQLALRQLDHLPDDASFPLALAALVFPWRQVVCRLARVADHDWAGRISQAMMDRWKLSQLETTATHWLLAHVQMIGHAPQLPWPRLQPILIHPLAGELLALATAVHLASDGANANLEPIRWCAARREWPTERLNPLPLVNGYDLQQAGVKPGPRLGRLLQQIRDAQLNGEIATSEEALRLVRRLIEATE